MFAANSKILIRAVALTALLSASEYRTAATPRPASPLPREVRNYIADMNHTCRRLGGMPSASPRLVRAVDLTGDRRLDYVVDEGGYICINSRTAFYAGHNGAALSIFVGVPGGTAYLGYEGYSHGVTVRKQAGRFRIHLIVGALACGQAPGPKAFSDWWFCHRPLRWNSSARRFQFAPLSQVRMLDRRGNRSSSR